MRPAVERPSGRQCPRSRFAAADSLLDTRAMVEEELPLPKFEPHEKVCGNCKLWSPHSTDHRGWVGPCRMQSQRGLFPPSAPVCDKFAPRGVASQSLTSTTNSVVPSGGTR